MRTISASKPLLGIIETACKAEELGFDAVLLNDHIIVDGSPRALPSWGNTYDPLIVLSYIAARTTRIRLGTSVLIMPYRNPVATAKMMATLDQMSGGRLIAGVGAGGVRPSLPPSECLSASAGRARRNTSASGRPVGRLIR